MKKFLVEVFDNFDDPMERCCSKVGEFDNVDDALACARKIVDKSLRDTRKPDPVDWYKTYCLFGDGVYAFGCNFNPYLYAEKRIEEITGVALADPWGVSR